MSKKLTALITLLIASWSSFSQTPSITSNPCKVPCYTLRNALKVRQRVEYLDTQVNILRDSIHTYQRLMLSKDTMLRFKDSQILINKSNEQNYKTIVKNQQETIKDLKLDKTISYLLLGVSYLITLIIAI